MFIEVRVAPKSSRSLVKDEGGFLKVYLTSPAQDGQANGQLVKLLSEHFKVKKYMVRIVKGERSRSKLVEIDV